MPEVERSVYEFGPFCLDVVERRLLRDGQPVVLTDKVFELLLLLVQNQGHALGKAELMDRLWPETAVEENNLTVNISILRKALGETASERRYIETLPRRGYRFIGSLAKGATVAGAVEPAASPLETQRRAHAEYATHAGRNAFVGRERELARLDQALAAALAGHGRLVFVTGPPGMGKTELCEQFVARASQKEALASATGHCLEQYGTREAYLPFLTLVGELLGGPERAIVTDVLRRYAPSWCAQFPAVFRPEELVQSAGAGGLRANAGRMLREMSDALEALTVSTPALLVLEDLHWADPSSCDVLRLIAQRIGGWRALVLATFRAEQVELESHPLKNLKRELLAHDRCDEIVLPLLEPPYIASYLDARFPRHALPRELGELITQTSEGQPLFATRLVQLLVDRGDIIEHDGRWALARPVAELELGVPDTVRGLIEKKLESLAEDDRRALQYASAIGVEFSSAALAALLATDEVALEERLDRLARVHRLLQQLGEERLPDGGLTVRYRFAHVLYQNVIHDGLANKRCITLHARVAEYLLAQYGAGQPRIAAQLALHFEAARNFARAIDYLIEAADTASHLHATREATRLYAHALELVERLEPKERAGRYVILHYNLGWCRGKLGDHAAGMADFDAMLEHARAPEFSAADADAARAQDLAFAYFHQSWRDVFGVHTLPRMQNQERTRGAPAFQCEAYWGICYMLLNARRFDALAQRADECLRLAEASNNQPRRVEVLAWMSLRELELLELERAVHAADESIRSGRELGHTRALFLALSARAGAHGLLGDHALAEELFLEALELTFEAQGRLTTLIELIGIRMARGDVAGAFSALDEARTIVGGTEREDWLQEVVKASGAVHLELLDFEQSVAYSRQAVELARKHGLVRAEVQAWIQLARAYAGSGHAAHAAHAIEAIGHAERRIQEVPESAGELDRRIGRLDLLNFEWAKAECSLAGGELDVAERHARGLARRATELRLVLPSAVAWQLLARIALTRGDALGAQSVAQTGLDALGTCALPFVRWRLLVALGRARLEASEQAPARACFDDARGVLAHIARSVPIAALRAIFSSSGDVQAVLQSRT